MLLVINNFVLCNDVKVQNGENCYKNAKIKVNNLFLARKLYSNSISNIHVKNGVKIFKTVDTVSVPKKRGRPLSRRTKYRRQKGEYKYICYRDSYHIIEWRDVGDTTPQKCHS